MSSEAKTRLLSGEPIEPIHRMHQSVGAKRNHRVTRPLSSLLDDEAFRLGKRRQHVGGLPSSLVVASDSDSQSRQRFRSHEINDTLHAVVTCRAAFRTNADSADRQVNVVNDYENVFGIEPQTPRQVADSFSAPVYERLRLRKYNRMSPHSSICHETSRAAVAAKLSAGPRGQQVKDDKSHVMAGSFVPQPGIAQSNDEPLATSHCIPGFATG